MSTPTPANDRRDDIDDLDELVLEPTDDDIDRTIIELYEERQVS